MMMMIKKQQFILLSTLLYVSISIAYPGNGMHSNNITGTSSKVKTYTYPRTIPLSNEIQFYANNKEAEVCKSSAGPFVAFSCKGEVAIEIKMPDHYDQLSISPLRHNITPDIEGKTISFTIPGPMLFALMDGHTPLLYIYANPFDTNKPEASGPNVKYYKAGQIYEIGELTLSDNETLYIEGGAVVRGNVVARSAENVKISGYGVFDGSYYTTENRHRSIVFEECKNSGIENIIMIEPTAWMIVLGICDNITVSNVKQLGYVMTSDGVDIVGSSNVRVENCFLRNHDDCIAIKSFDMRKYGPSATKDWSKNVENIEVTDCILWSYGGMSFEIGHELTTDSIKNIRYINCDAIVHSYGGIFGIHNADWATISNVLYEDIRVEHYYNKLIDFRIIKTKYSGKGVPGRKSNRGHIHDIILKDIDVKVTPWNIGISLSHIGGYDKDHTIKDVTIENFILDGKKVTNADQLELYIKQASDIIFK